MLEVRQKSTIFSSRDGVNRFEKEALNQAARPFHGLAAVTLKEVNPAGRLALRIFLANRVEMNLFFRKNILNDVVVVGFIADDHRAPWYCRKPESDRAISEK